MSKKVVLYVDQGFKEGVEAVTFANDLFRKKEVSIIIFYIEEELCIQTMFDSISFFKSLFPEHPLYDDNVAENFLHYDFYGIELDDFLEILQSDREVKIEFFSREEKYSSLRKEL